jgi:DNA-binding transcriptional MerR regulator
MTKSRDAFRTISEVAEWLDTPAHVLRFWESKFTQVKPVKRAGGRRYYRPQDMELLAGIKALLHDDGMTIKGAQKLLREKGIKHVSGMGRSLDEDEGPGSAPAVDAQPATAEDRAPAAPPDAAPATATGPGVPPPAEVTPPHVDPGHAPGPDNVLPLTSAPETADPAPAADDTDSDASDEPPAAAGALDGIPDDPADSDAKARPRIMHLIRRIPEPERKLRARAAEIAPLLDRMQALRDRLGPY